jgi:hypothetical protein
MLASNSLGLVPANWHIAGTGDFNGDSKSDILWRNDAGAVAVWDMDDGTLLRSNSLGLVPANWRVAGIGDYNGDHKSDILWRNDAGPLAIWDMDDGTLLSSNPLGSVPDNWHIIAEQACETEPVRRAIYSVSDRMRPRSGGTRPLKVSR